jgi:hypothetical protein
MNPFEGTLAHAAHRERQRRNKTGRGSGLPNYQQAIAQKLGLSDMAYAQASHKAAKNEACAGQALTNEVMISDGLGSVRWIRPSDMGKATIKQGDHRLRLMGMDLASQKSIRGIRPNLMICDDLWPQTYPDEVRRNQLLLLTC